MEATTGPVYTNGDYHIYKFSKNHFVHTFKNIVFAERGAANRELIDNLIADNKPTDEASLYHDYERPKQAIQEGIEAAKNLFFVVH